MHGRTRSSAALIGMLLLSAFACAPGSTEEGATLVPGCKADKECPATYFCVSGACQSVPAACQSTSDCTSGDICLVHHCLPDPDAGTTGAVGDGGPVSDGGTTGTPGDGGTSDAGPGGADAGGGTSDAGGGTSDAGPGGADAGGGGGSGLVNGTFESGLSGWVASGQTSVSSIAHSGAQAAQVGSASTGADSALEQQIVLPSGSPQLSLWYKVVCSDAVNYDWATALVKSPSGVVLATAVPHTCNNNDWTRVSSDLTAFAGQTVVVALQNHDDGHAGDPTYTLYDDVAINTSATGGSPDFSLVANPASVTGSGSTTLAAAAIAGFGGSIALAASGAPTGASASLSATRLSASGSATLSLTPGSAAAGTYAITVTGTSGALTHTASISWTIAAAACTTDTWGNFAANLFTGSCASCHSYTHSYDLSTYSGVKADQSQVQSRISSGAMPRGSALSASDKSRILKWLSCGLPQ